MGGQRSILTCRKDYEPYFKGYTAEVMIPKNG